ncbi:hypothetical protein BCR36DRAFT_347922 [Piromyces finnis]|uniref:SH3 domain-containing protein n=1 Tax=Piromyces finnis TaxID=1754191 RepID=A0A1Y1VFC1_9FUNG|nr:hypothetical protein BCR36DRAFT_347922 [Piromyces finnis]|eukprot:ORX54815.1 hypothetical protein BCR36DRAFT_347922 [Piromyces finnis]
MRRKNLISTIIIIVFMIIKEVQSHNEEKESLINLFKNLTVLDVYANDYYQILQGNINNNNNLVTLDQNGHVIKLNIGSKLDKSANNILNESICNLIHLEVLDLANNNLKGNRMYYGQLPECLNNLTLLHTFNISGNKFRGHLPKLNSSSLKICNLDLGEEKNELCLFHKDTIPVSCLNFESELKSFIDYPNDKIFFKNNKIELCKNIFVSNKEEDKNTEIRKGEKKNTDKDVIIYSSIFPLVSLIITVGATMYGRIKSKFNKKDNITTFTASLSHLPNNFGNGSNTNNHQSHNTKFDSFIQPAPRPDNENSSLFNSKTNSLSIVDQKRISSNPSTTSVANTSVSSTIQQSPVMASNEIKNLNYRVIGSNYPLNSSEVLHLKNNTSIGQSNRINAMSSNINSTQSTIVQETMSKVEKTNCIDNSIINSNISNNTSNSTPSKALESLDMLLSSPQAMYYREKISPSLRPGMKSSKAISPIQLTKSYPSKMNPYSPSINLYSRSPINKDKSPTLVNSNSEYSTKIPTSPAISVPKYMSSLSPDIKSQQSLRLSQATSSNNYISHIPKKPRVRRVVYSFIADLPDELQLTPGQEVIIHKVFDDGYAYGENASSGQLGVFPITSLHPDDQDILPEEIESSPSLNDMQFSQLSMNKSPTLISPLMNYSLSPSKFNNIKIQEISQSLIANKSNINSHDISIDNYGRAVNTNNLYPINNSQNSNSQNSNSQNSLTDEDDIDTLRKQSKIGYSAFMDQQKQKLIKKQAKQARKNKMKSLNSNYYNNDKRFYQEPPFSPTNLMQNIVLNENVNNRMFGNNGYPSQLSYNSQLSNDIASSSSPFYSSQYKNGISPESQHSLEMQRIEDRRYKQIKLLNDRLSKKDIGPEEKRYYLKLLQQLTN